MAQRALDLMREARQRGRPLVVAHRGGRALFPENSLEAFARCWGAGADGVELDVRLCSSGEPVVFHDERLDERTDGSGPVAARPWAELRKLRIRDSRGRLSDQRIPHLADALAVLEAERYLNVEVKHDRGDPRPLVRALGRVLRGEPAAGRRPVVLSSFHPAALAACRFLLPEFPRGLLLGSQPRERLPQWFSRALTAPGALHLGRPIVSDELLARARKSRWEVAVWTVNEEVHLESLCRRGVAALITDRPDRARTVVDRCGGGQKGTP